MQAHRVSPWVAESNDRIHSRLQADPTSETTPAPEDSASGGAVGDTGDTPAPVVPSPPPTVASPLVSSASDDALSAAEIVGIVLGVIVAIPTIGAGIAKMYACVKGWRKRP